MSPPSPLDTDATAFGGAVEVDDDLMQYLDVNDEGDNHILSGLPPDNYMRGAQDAYGLSASDYHSEASASEFSEGGENDLFVGPSPSSFEGHSVLASIKNEQVEDERERERLRLQRQRDLQDARQYQNHAFPNHSQSQSQNQNQNQNQNQFHHNPSQFHQLHHQSTTPTQGQSSQSQNQNPQQHQHRQSVPELQANGQHRHTPEDSLRLGAGQLPLSLPNHTRHVHKPSTSSLIDHLTFGAFDPPSNEDINLKLPPHDYANVIANGPEKDLQFNVSLSQFPARSRVETQIKCRLAISPPPTQTILRLPSDTLARPRFELADSSSIEGRADILWLDVDAVLPESPNTRIFMCEKCLSRERKRAFRKKTLDPNEELYWDDNRQRRLLIFNCKELVELPPTTTTVMPNGEETEVREFELPLRLACYCRHHAAKSGYNLLFTLRNHNGQLVGRAMSTPVFITDNHKEPRVSDERRTSVTGAVHPHPYARSGSTQPRPRSDSNVSSDWSVSSASSASGFSVGLTPQSSSGSALQSPSSTEPSPAASVSANFLHATSPGSDQMSGSGGSGPANINGLRRPRASQSEAVGGFGALGGHSSLMAPLGGGVDAGSSGNEPVIQRVIPASGSVRGGVEVTLLGQGFQPGLTAMFGESAAITTQCWSSSTIIAHLPPAQQAGPVSVTFDGHEARTAVFTYVDDGEHKLKELALQVVGFKMSGRIEEAGDIAQRILDTTEPGSFTALASGPASGGANDAAGFTANGPSAEQLALRVLGLVQQRGRVPQLNLRNSEGQTMMHLAAMLGYDSVVRQLLAQGAAVSNQDVSGYTPLHFAALFGQRHITRMLLGSGDADPFHRTLSGLTVAEVADSTVVDLLPRDQRTYYQELNSRSSSCSSLLALSSSGEPATPDNNIFLTPQRETRQGRSTTVRQSSSAVSLPSVTPPPYSQLYPDGKLDPRVRHPIIELNINESEGSSVQSESESGVELELANDDDEDDDEDDDDDDDDDHVPFRDEELLKRWAANPLKQIQNDRMLLTFWIPVLLMAMSCVLYVLFKDHFPALRPIVEKPSKRLDQHSAIALIRSFAINVFN